MAGKRPSKSIPDWPAAKGYRLRVHWDDTDCTKRVYLGKYIKWIDDACTEYLRERGLVFDPDGWLYLNGKALNEGFVVGEYTCRIEHTSDFDDVLTVKIGIKDKRPKVVVFKGEIFDRDGQMVAHGTLTYIYIKRGMKAVPMPPEIFELMQ